MRKTFRCYVNAEGMEKTISGKRKIWRTDKVDTYCCCLYPSWFVWEKNTLHNDYQGWSGYVQPKLIELID